MANLIFTMDPTFGFNCIMAVAVSRFQGMCPIQVLSTEIPLGSMYGIYIPIGSFRYVMWVVEMLQMEG